MNPVTHSYLDWLSARKAEATIGQYVGKYRLTAERKGASYPPVMNGRNNELLLREALRLRSAAVGF